MTNFLFNETKEISLFIHTHTYTNAHIDVGIDCEGRRSGHLFLVCHFPCTSSSTNATLIINKLIRRITVICTVHGPRWHIQIIMTLYFHHEILMAFDLIHSRTERSRARGRTLSMNQVLFLVSLTAIIYLNEMNKAVRRLLCFEQLYRKQIYISV